METTFPGRKGALELFRSYRRVPLDVLNNLETSTFDLTLSQRLAQIGNDHTSNIQERNLALL